MHGTDKPHVPTWVKFAAGVTAGVCATMFPKLSAVLAADGDWSLMTMGYIVAASAISVIVGAVVVFREWSEYNTPNEIFMTALGIPALLVGGYNSGMNAANARATAEEKAAIIEEFAEDAGIEELGPVSSLDSAFTYVGGDIEYYVVLFITSFSEEADILLVQAKADFPDAYIHKYEDTYYILLSARVFDRQEALVEALRVRKVNPSLSPKLLPKHVVDTAVPA